MPDQLTSDVDAGPVPTHQPPPRRARRVGSLLQALAVVVLFVAGGAGLAVLWEHLWQPTQGLVVRREWFVVDPDLRYDLDGLRNEFSGTALFVLLGLGGGLVLGTLSAVLLARDELVTLAAVLVGSVAAALVMWQLGAHLGPPDPDLLAAEAERGTVLPDNLELGSPGALLAWPFASLLALCAVFFLLPGRGRK